MLSWRRRQNADETASVRKKGLSGLPCSGGLPGDCDPDAGLREVSDMKRVMLVVAYDGTNYCGWQIQANGITIQEELNRCLSKLLKEPIQTVGASRTDAGVHALGNVAVFDTTARMPAEKISYALNTYLPEDIRIQYSAEVAADFHPRYCESEKTY